jgi:hypothetical protein
MKILAELKGERAALGLTVAENGGRASKEPYIAAFRGSAVGEPLRPEPARPSPPGPAPSVGRCRFQLLVITAVSTWLAVLARRGRGITVPGCCSTHPRESGRRSASG